MKRLILATALVIAATWTVSEVRAQDPIAPPTQGLRIVDADGQVVDLEGSGLRIVAADGDQVVLGLDGLRVQSEDGQVVALGRGGIAINTAP